nr:MAG TPA: hypothetical protein [Caudoviricetes sp.]
MEKFILSFIETVITFGAIYLMWLLIVELFKIFGTVTILGLIAFIGVWVVWYIVSDD